MSGIEILWIPIAHPKCSFVTCRVKQTEMDGSVELRTRMVQNAQVTVVVVLGLIVRTAENSAWTVVQ